MLVLVDNNYADRDMADYLAASPDNKAALPHTVLEEWHKEFAASNTRKLMKIACQYPEQIILLKDTRDLIHLSGKPTNLLLRLIDRQQTRDFSAYCDTVINAPLTAELEARFKAHEEHTRATMEELTREAHKMMAMFQKWDKGETEDDFTKAELREMNGLLEREQKLSTGLQRKTFEKAIKLGGAMFVGNNVDRDKLPRIVPELANLLSFRYGVMMVAFYVKWRNAPGTYPNTDKTALNWLNDLKIAAQATYFDGFRTKETRLEPVYEIGLGLIKALGGYTNCGNYELPDELKMTGSD